ncbi:MAG: hypothetical protein ACRD3E_14215 [Terriglobales bacterium]
MSCDPRFDVNRPNVCEGLRWKGQFIRAEHAFGVQPAGDTSFWCSYTQTCIGPDGIRAEPGMCSSSFRACHNTGQCGN